jgi:Mrp family chromosome partitioning ATPase
MVSGIHSLYGVEKETKILTSDSGAIIVSTAQDVALADVKKGVAMFQKVKVPVSSGVDLQNLLCLPPSLRCLACS